MSHYENELYLTPKERKKALILVVETDPAQRHNMRSTLQKLGFGGITDVPSHAAAIEKIQTRPVTHIIFDAKKNEHAAERLRQSSHGTRLPFNTDTDFV